MADGDELVRRGFYAPMLSKGVNDYGPGWLSFTPSALWLTKLAETTSDNAAKQIRLATHQVLALRAEAPPK
jgi:hypothetical protein